MQYRGNNVLYGGIDFSITGEGGPDCLAFLSPAQRLTETLVFGVFSVALILYSWRKVWPVNNNNNNNNNNTCWSRLRGGGEYQVSKQCLLMIFSLVLGLELGYKLSTGQLLWVLNPCHVLTVTQLLLLVSPPNRLTSTLFRLHIYWLTGPVLAILFPVTVTRHIAGEVITYWVQHLLLLLVPGYLLATDQYSVEPTADTDWPLLSLSVFSAYHWLVLQPIGLVTGVNLNNMLCPAASDPFGTTYYRIIAMSYFVFLLPLVGKLYSLAAKYLISTKGANNELKEEKLS